MQIGMRTENGFPHKIKTVIHFNDLPPFDTYAENVGSNIDHFNMIEYQVTLPYRKVAGHSIQEIYLDSMPYNSYLSIMIKANSDGIEKEFNATEKPSRKETRESDGTESGKNYSSA